MKAFDQMYLEYEFAKEAKLQIKLKNLKQRCIRGFKSFDVGRQLQEVKEEAKEEVKEEAKEGKIEGNTKEEKKIEKKIEKKEEEEK